MTKRIFGCDYDEFYTATHQHINYISFFCTSDNDLHERMEGNKMVQYDKLKSSWQESK